MRHDLSFNAKFITKIEFEDCAPEDQNKIYIDEVNETEDNSFGFDFELTNGFNTLEIFELFDAASNFTGILCLPLPKKISEAGSSLTDENYELNFKHEENVCSDLQVDMNGIELHTWSIAHEGMRFWINSFGCGPDPVLDGIPEMFDSNFLKKSFSSKDISEEIKSEFVELEEFYLSPAALNCDFYAHVDGDAIDGKIFKPILILPDANVTFGVQKFNLHYS